MTPDKTVDPDVSPVLLEAIASFPVRRDVRHCGVAFTTGPFAVYATCPVCGTRFKIRSFSAHTELEDVFDAVFTWMLQPGAEEAVKEQLAVIAADAD